ncbi:MAG TPA: LysM peptidoglycan-binding domain-containing protein [Aliidongia sp.]|uniref:LysM peptidoglycan-binding domain-containing protein n=1 Tax=Aliidongia sp. TaxID=1914230 RepID=UPI002DDD2556|nr:LysM peptidoglycan-binding domain-containing protein [Aliidongia sp.]HEV2674769.1 LysM peptidoglycan-binding domain-containing protein [Aliidongia sp.]
MRIALGGTYWQTTVVSPPPPPPPPPAAEVSAAYSTIAKGLSSGKTMQQAIADASANTTLSAQAIAEAALLIQVQRNAQIPPAAGASPSDPFEQAATQLGNLTGPGGETVISPYVLSNAKNAMEGGTVSASPGLTMSSYNAPGCSANSAVPDVVPALPPGQSSPTVSQALAQIQQYENEGMSFQEALGAARVQFGGSVANEVTLAEASLANHAPGQVDAYANDPSGSDPIQLASKQISSLNLFNQSVLDTATKNMTATLPTTPVDSTAAQAAGAKLAKDQANNASPATIAADMAAYRQALIPELDAITGKTGTAWMGPDDLDNDPTSLDAWLKGTVAVTQQNLLGLGQAAYGTAPNSTENQALDTGCQDIDAAFNDIQTLIDVGGTKGNAAQAQQLTGDLLGQGLIDKNGNPVANSTSNPTSELEYDDIMNDPSIQQLKSTAQSDIIAAADPTQCVGQSGAESALLKTSRVLGTYQGSVFYSSLLAGTIGSAPVQQLFKDLDDVGGSTGPDVLHNQTAVMKAVNDPADLDLSNALYNTDYKTSVENAVKNDTWTTPDGSILSLGTAQQAPEYYADVSNLYDSLGGGSTSDGKSLRTIVTNRMNSDNFVGNSYYGSLTPNGKNETIKSFFLGSINGQNGNPDGDPQLYVDIADTDKNSNTVSFIKAELPGKLSATSAANAVPAYQQPGVAVLPSGPITITSRADLSNVLGVAYNLTPTANPAADGSQYNGNSIVYGSTTLTDLVNATLASQNQTDVSALDPIILTLVATQYWSQGEDPNKATPQCLWLEETVGDAGHSYLGPGGAPAQSTYQDWQKNNGLGPGTLQSQERVVTNAAGQQLVNWNQTNITAPESWEEKALHVTEVVATVAAVAVTTFVAPEAEGLLLPMLYDAAQAYFTVTSISGAVQAAKNIAKNPTSWRTWVGNGFTIAADVFMGSTGIGHFGLTRVPALLGRGLEVGQAVDQGLDVTRGGRVLAALTDNTAGAKTYMALAGAPDGLMTALNVAHKGSALTNGVLMGVQGFQIGDALVHGQSVSASTIIQFVTTIGMGQFGKVFGIDHITSLRGGDKTGEAPVTVPPDTEAAPADLTAGGLPTSITVDQIASWAVSTPATGADTGFIVAGDGSARPVATGGGRPAAAPKHQTSSAPTEGPATTVDETTLATPLIISATALTVTSSETNADDDQPSARSGGRRHRADVGSLAMDENHSGSNPNGIEHVGTEPSSEPPTTRKLLQTVGSESPVPEACQRQGCGGQIEDGTCTRCGLGPDQTDFFTLRSLSGEQIAELPELTPQEALFATDVNNEILERWGEYINNNKKIPIEDLVHYIPDGSVRLGVMARYFRGIEGGPKVLIRKSTLNPDEHSDIMRKAYNVSPDETILDIGTARSTLAHEILHHYTSTYFDQDVSSFMRSFQYSDEKPVNLAEGITELLSWRGFGNRPGLRTIEGHYSYEDYFHHNAVDALIRRSPVDDDVVVSMAYKPETAAAEFLFKLAGRKTVYDAYFGGKSDALDIVYDLTEGPVTKFFSIYSRHGNVRLAETVALMDNALTPSISAPTHTFVATAALTKLPSDGTPFKAYTWPLANRVKMVSLSDLGFAAESNEGRTDAYLTVSRTPGSPEKYGTLIPAAPETGLPLGYSAVHPMTGALAVGMTKRGLLWPGRGAQDPAAVAAAHGSPASHAVRNTIENGTNPLLVSAEHFQELTDAPAAGPETYGMGADYLDPATADRQLAPKQPAETRAFVQPPSPVRPSRLAIRAVAGFGPTDDTMAPVSLVDGTSRQGLASGDGTETRAGEAPGNAPAPSGLVNAEGIGPLDTIARGVNYSRALAELPLQGVADITFADDLLRTTPYEFLLGDDFVYKWDNYKNAIALHFTDPTEVTRERAQQISDIVGVSVLTPRIDAPADWEVLTPKPMTASSGDRMVFDKLSRRVFSVDESGARTGIQPEYHLGRMTRVGGLATAFELGPNLTVVVQRSLVRDFANKKTRESVNVANDLEDLGAPHSAKIHGILWIFGQSAHVMDRYAATDSGLWSYSGPQIFPLYDVSLFNEKSVESLEATKNWMISRNVNVRDMQFLIAQDGTFELAYVAKVFPRASPNLSDLNDIDQLIRLIRAGQATRNKASLSEAAAAAGSPDLVANASTPAASGTSGLSELPPQVYSFVPASSLSEAPVEGTPFKKYSHPDGAAVPMVRLSDMGYPVDQQARIQTAEGPQTKPAGTDGYLVVSPDAGAQGPYQSLILTDATDLPVGYAAVHPTNGALAVGMVKRGPLWPAQGAQDPAAAAHNAGANRPAITNGPRALVVYGDHLQDLVDAAKTGALTPGTRIFVYGAKDIETLPSQLKSGLRARATVGQDGTIVVDGGKTAKRTQQAYFTPGTPVSSARYVVADAQAAKAIRKGNSFAHDTYEPPRPALDISAAYAAGDLKPVEFKPGGWPGGVFRDTAGTYGPKDTAHLVKWFPVPDGEYIARNAVATSEIYREAWGKGAASKLQLVSWTDPQTGKVVYGTMTAINDAKFSTRGARKALTKPGVASEGVSLDIALQNVGVVGSDYSNLGVISEKTSRFFGRTTKLKYRVDNDSAAGVNQNGVLGTYGKVDFRSAVENLRNGVTSPGGEADPTVREFYGTMPDSDVVADIDRLNTQIGAGLSDKIRTIVLEHGGGTRTQRVAVGQQMVANVEGIVAWREAEFPGIAAEPSSLPAGYQREAPLQKSGRRIFSGSYIRSKKQGGDPRPRWHQALDNTSFRITNLFLRIGDKEKLFPAPDPRDSNLELPSTNPPGKMPFDPSRSEFLPLRFTSDSDKPAQGMVKPFDAGKKIEIGDIDPTAGTPASKTPSKVKSDPEYYYAYLPDGSGRPLGYVVKQENGTTWVPRSDVGPRKLQAARVVTGITLAGIAGYLGYDHVTWLRSFKDTGPSASFLRYAVSSAKMFKKFHDRTIEAVRAGRLDKAAYVIDNNYRIATWHASKRGISTETLAANKTATETMLGFVQQARLAQSRGEFTPDAQSELLQRFETYLQGMQLRSGIPSDGTDWSDPATWTGLGVRTAVTTLQGVSLAISVPSAMKILKGVGWSSLGSSLNVIGFVATIASTVRTTARARSSDPTYKPGKIQKKVDTVLDKTGTYTFAAGYFTGALETLATHGSILTTASEAFLGAASIAADRLTPTYRHFDGSDEKICVYKDGKLVGYATRAPAGQVSWHALDDKGAFEPVTLKPGLDFIKKLPGSAQALLIVRATEPADISRALPAAVPEAGKAMDRLSRRHKNYVEFDISKVKARIATQGKRNPKAMGLVLGTAVIVVDVTSVIRKVFSPSTSEVPKKSASASPPSPPQPPPFHWHHPKELPPPPVVSPPAPHIVRPGETLSEIAKNAGISLAALEQANPQISNDNSINSGERVNLPVPSTPSQP